YSNRDRESTAFLQELTELDREHENIRVLLTMTQDPGWKGEHRRIGPELLRDRLDGELTGARYLVAGPPGMVDATVEALQETGVPDERVVADRFSGYYAPRAGQRARRAGGGRVHRRRSARRRRVPAGMTQPRFAPRTDGRGRARRTDTRDRRRNGRHRRGCAQW